MAATTAEPDTRRVDPDPRLRGGFGVKRSVKGCLRARAERVLRIDPGLMLYILVQHEDCDAASTAA